MAKKIEHAIGHATYSQNKIKIGTAIFALGAGIAIVSSFIYPGGLNLAVSSVLIAMGIIVGMLNISAIETNNFLLAIVSQVVMTALGGAVLSQIPTIGIYIEGILLSIMTFVLPMGIIVALKVVYRLAQD